MVAGRNNWAFKLLENRINLTSLISPADLVNYSYSLPARLAAPQSWQPASVCLPGPPLTVNVSAGGPEADSMGNQHSSRPPFLSS